MSKNLKWKTEGISKDAKMVINKIFRNDYISGNDDKEMSISVPYNDGSYSWAIPESHPIKAYYLRISCVEGCDVSDDSDSYFKIVEKAENNDPVIKKEYISSTEVNVGEFVNISFTADDLDGDPINWSVSWKESEPFSSGYAVEGNIFKSSHKWEEAGGHLVRVKATDSHGGIDTYSFGMNVNEIECEETDSGKEYDEKGSTTGWDAYGGDTSRKATYTDKCDGGDRLMEFYCNNGNVTMTNVPCENGCYDGICMPQNYEESGGEVIDVSKNNESFEKQLASALESAREIKEKISELFSN